MRTLSHEEYVIACRKAEEMWQQGYTFRPVSPPAPNQFWCIKGTGEFYDVDLTGHTCTCPGFGHRGYCKHITFVAESVLASIQVVAGLSGEMRRQMLERLRGENR